MLTIFLTHTIMIIIILIQVLQNIDNASTQNLNLFFKSNDVCLMYNQTIFAKAQCIIAKKSIFSNQKHLSLNKTNTTFISYDQEFNHLFKRVQFPNLPVYQHALNDIKFFIGNSIFLVDNTKHLVEYNMKTGQFKILPNNYHITNIQSNYNSTLTEIEKQQVPLFVTSNIMLLDTPNEDSSTLCIIKNQILGNNQGFLHIKNNDHVFQYKHNFSGFTQIVKINNKLVIVFSLVEDKYSIILLNNEINILSQYQNVSLTQMQQIVNIWRINDQCVDNSHQNKIVKCEKLIKNIINLKTHTQNIYYYISTYVVVMSIHLIVNFVTQIKNQQKIQII